LSYSRTSQMSIRVNFQTQNLLLKTMKLKALSSFQLQVLSSKWVFNL